MRKNLIFLFVVLMCATLIVAHPHFRRTSTVAISQGQEVSVQHVTYPWNEANPSRFPAEGWAPGAKLKTSVSLMSGSTSIPSGEYDLKILKDGEDFDMELTSGSDTYELDTMTEHGLSMQDHLMMDIHVTGDSGYLDIRYGTFNVRGKITASQ